MKDRQSLRFFFGERAVLVAILLIAFALRVYRLGVPAIWWDESLSVYRATRDLGAVLSNVIIIQNVITIDTLPQLYFVLLHFLVRVFGIGEFALRFFSIVANIATIPLLYALARRWLNPSAGCIAAFLGALSPFYVWYAQEARPYALVLFWSTLAVYALTRAFYDLRFTSSDLRWFGVYIFAATASLYTHYFAIFLLPFHVVLMTVLIWQKTHWRARLAILLPAIPFVLMLFLLPQIRASAAGNADTGPYFVPLSTILIDLLNSFSAGVTLDWQSAWWIDGAMFVLFLIGLGFAIRKPQFAILNLAYLLLPIASIFLLSFIRPLYQNSRYLIAISPAFYLGAAAGVVALGQRWKILAPLALGILVVGAAISLNNLYFNPRFGKDDHRAWAESLRERMQDGDFLILNSPHTEELYRYYADDIVPMTTLPILHTDGKPSPEADLAAVRDAYRNHSRIWYLAMHVPFDDPQKRIEKFLNTEGVLIDQASFAGTSTEIALSLFVPMLPSLPPSAIAHGLNVTFAGNLRLRGYDAPSAMQASAKSIVKLYWQIDEPVGEDYAVSLRAVDAAGKIIGQWDTVPLGNRAGASTWEPQKIIVDARQIWMAQPGKYRWQVVPYHSATGNPLGDVITLGNVEVK